MPTAMQTDGTRSGLPAVGAVSWGAHMCQFYRDSGDLLDTLVPFFATGLTAGERCLWVTSPALPAATAYRALAGAVPDIDGYWSRGQLEVFDHEEWYVRNGRMGADEVLDGWLEREQRALADGFAGLRISGDTYWLEDHEWDTFAEYESRVHRAFHDRRIVALCSYALGRCGPDRILEVLRNHGCALLRRDGEWQVMQSATMLLAQVEQGAEIAPSGPVGHLTPIDGYPVLQPDAGDHRSDGRSQLLAQLAQSRAALDAETRARAKAERQRDRLRDEEQTARMRALQAADQMGRLQRVTAALAEVTTIGEIASIVSRELAELCGASRAALAVCEDGGQWLDVLGSDGDHRIELDVDPATPLVQVIRSARPQWQIGDEPGDGEPGGGEPRTLAYLPLLLRGRALGAIELVFAGIHEPQVAERALLEDQARQLAIAVDRARSYQAAERARDEAEQERARAESASRAKDEFLAMLGHELRNPLAPIVTALQLMKLRDDVRSGKERTIIERQVQHLVRLVDDLLDVSRITRGKVELRKRKTDLADVIARAVEMASPLLEQRQHHFKVSVPAGRLRLLGDEDRLTQVVANLLTNAARYTPHRGHIRLSAARDGDQVVIRVVDDGIGIAPELLSTIFEPFVQGARGPDRSEGGLGLGLMLVRSLVHMHGGTVSAHSDGPGTGAEMVIRLPALADDQRTSTPPPLERDERPAKPRGRRILVVDDNEDAAGTLADVLRESGYEVDVAHDGPAAVVRARSFHPDGAVLDIGLPVMDGYEVAERLRAEHGDAIWLVAVTGYGRDHDRVRSRQAGFDLHLVKPVDIDRLLKAVEPAGRQRSAG